MARRVTRQAKNNYRCHLCNVDLICPQCGKPQKMGTPFSLWLRQLNEPLDSRSVYNSDIDHVWWHYTQGWFITIEEKQYGAQINRSQQELINILSERLLAFVSEKQNTLRGFRKVEYRGHYNIIFEKTNPTDSAWIKINGKDANTDRLLVLLANGKLPSYPQNGIDRLVLEILPSFIT